MCSCVKWSVSSPSVAHRRRIQNARIEALYISVSHLFLCLVQRWKISIDPNPFFALSFTGFVYNPKHAYFIPHGLTSDFVSPPSWSSFHCRLESFLFTFYFPLPFAVVFKRYESLRGSTDRTLRIFMKNGRRNEISLVINFVRWSNRENVIIIRANIWLIFEYFDEQSTD